MGFNTIFKSSLNQNGYEPLNLENGSFVNSDVLMPPTWGLKPKVKLKWKPTDIVKKYCKMQQ